MAVVKDGGSGKPKPKKKPVTAPSPKPPSPVDKKKPNAPKGGTEPPKPVRPAPTPLTPQETHKRPGAPKGGTKKIEKTERQYERKLKQAGRGAEAVKTREARREPVRRANQERRVMDKSPTYSKPAPKRAPSGGGGGGARKTRQVVSTPVKATQPKVGGGGGGGITRKTRVGDFTMGISPIERPQGTARFQQSFRDGDLVGSDNEVTDFDGSVTTTGAAGGGTGSALFGREVVGRVGDFEGQSVEDIVYGAQKKGRKVRRARRSL